MNLPNRPKVKKPRIPRVSLNELVDNTSHVIVHNTDTGTVKCARCLSAFNSHSPALKPWLTTRCEAIGSSIDRPIPLTQSIHIKSSTTHVTHKLYIFKGLVYCNVCGTRASSSGLRDLSRPCHPPTSYGKQSLVALNKGKTPPNLTVWPCDVEP